jgi:glutathione S-transferase
MSKSLKLFGSTNPRSFNTLKIRCALAEIGADYEFVPVDVAKGAGRAPEFLRMNAHGKIPVLLDGDFALPESDAILWYLGEKFPDAKLLPLADGSDAALQARAQVIRFCDIASTAFYPAYSDWWNATNATPPNALAADSALVKVNRALGVLESVLAGGEYLVGAFSLADISMASILFALKRRLPLDPLSEFQSVKAWYARVGARPSWQHVTADE